MVEYPIDPQSQGAIENTQFAKLQALQLLGGLPVLTATPTYTGIQGEIVSVDDGSTRKICVYLNGTWRCQTIAAAATTLTFTQVDQSEHGVSTTDWEDYDISAIVPADTKYVEVLMHNLGAVARTGKTRNNGDTTITTVIILAAGSCLVETCPVTSQIIEVIGSNTDDVKFRILGYWK